MKVSIGSFVKSKKGRDLDKIYIVFSVKNDIISLVNGFNRTIDKPKHKNVKHIEVLGNCSETLRDKILSNKKIYDAEVYSAINKLTKS